MGTVKIRIPATSANLGAGFDSLGVALSLYNTFEIEEADGVFITALDDTKIPCDEGNLIYKTVAYLYQMCGVRFRGLSIQQQNDIPMARGLGSSSTCIVGALVGANEILGNVLNRQELMNMAVAIEGHPDNVMPAFLGGFVASVVEAGEVHYINKDIKGLEFAAFVPDFQLLTSEARAVLPKETSYQNAIYNLSRTGLAAAAFCLEQYDLLEIACEDKLHQPYRLPLIKNGEEIFAIAKECGAKAVFISGAGPTILAVLQQGNEQFFSEAKVLLKKREINNFQIVRLNEDNCGVTIQK